DAGEGSEVNGETEEVLEAVDLESREHGTPPVRAGESAAVSSPSCRKRSGESATLTCTVCAGRPPPRDAAGGPADERKHYAAAVASSGARFRRRFRRYSARTSRRSRRSWALPRRCDQ